MVNADKAVNLPACEPPLSFAAGAPRDIQLGVASGSVYAAAPVSVSISPASLTLAPGASAIVRLNFAIDESYHIYSTVQSMGSRGPGPTATTVTVKPEGIVAIDGAPKSSPPEKHYDPDFELDVGTLAGRPWIDVPLKAAANLPPGTHRLVLIVNCQACTEESCLSPADIEAPFEIVVPPTEGRSKSGN